MDTADNFAVSIVFLNNISVGDYMVKISNKVKIITAVLLIVLVFVQYVADYYSKTRVDCLIKTENKNPLIHINSKSRV